MSICSVRLSDNANRLHNFSTSDSQCFSFWRNFNKNFITLSNKSRFKFALASDSRLMISGSILYMALSFLDSSLKNRRVLADTIGSGSSMQRASSLICPFTLTISFKIREDRIDKTTFLTVTESSRSDEKTFDIQGSTLFGNL
ncbi:hypothetical protein RF11_06356 [Thelohanellus kitauei]|uniref:Uncharacterized protein n=1 Tax=Thelohanellus kitauei TaxID=669202 RepID=A0A0C2MUV1_THEKT|nr:hypothetical protein RF11_06356 [Thelohanellus kitauei]